MKYLKQFLKDFWNLERYEFARKYLILPTCLFFLWCAIGRIIEVSLTKDDLIKVSGTVTGIKIVTTNVIDKPLYKEKEQELRIFINNYTEYFSLSDEINYEEIFYDISIGDTINIYHRSLLMSILGLGGQHEIYQLEHNGRVYFSLNTKVGNSFGVIFVSIVGFIGFSGFYICLKVMERYESSTSTA